ncbi:alpha/beta hydrolase [Sphingomonas cannabina]|uniref:alpha/beta hydrolase n=1 Tax=Sphingomonas cannabina TaxID=2899123 RepID=UPI001F293D09|nr:alpha/beta hydrolase [Sphingomonas cannabina]UIJ43983.1 alpha/beta hydrolase [Sphingomonas cannabina]
MSSNIDRRTLLAGGVMLGAASVAGAQSTLPPGFERFAIWPGPAPGGEKMTAVEEERPRSPDGPPDDTAFTHVTRPTLTVVRPAKSNGAALLLVPGGGYRRVAIGRGGHAIARRFADAGYTCFILLYRLPGDAWAAGPDAPLQDAQRAIRLIRARAKRDGFDGERIGVLGFSAGGHLAARLAAQPDLATYAAVDAADALPARPTIAGLLYPVASMADGIAHMGSRNELLGRQPSEQRIAAYSTDRLVTGAMPPTFLAHAVDDTTVPVENSLALFSALQAQKVPREMHLFETGGHGFALQLPDGTTSPWPELFIAWSRRHGMG